METGILSDVKAKRSKSARQTQMHLSIYATSVHREESEELVSKESMKIVSTTDRLVLADVYTN